LEQKKTQLVVEEKQSRRVNALDRELVDPHGAEARRENNVLRRTKLLGEPFRARDGRKIIIPPDRDLATWWWKKGVRKV
jgi:hypothetical protein